MPHGMVCSIFLQPDSLFFSCTIRTLSMFNTTLIRLLMTQYVEGILTYFPNNPLSEPFGEIWMSLNQRYTNFQLATFGSVIFHEVSLRHLHMYLQTH